MLNLNRQIVLSFIFLLSFSAFSQTKQDLKKQKEALEKQINYTSKLLKETKKSKNKSLTYLRVLDNKIQKKEMRLKTLNVEISVIANKINLIEMDILKTEQIIKTKNNNLDLLKNEYAKMIYASFKKRGSKNDFMFVISSEDFNQAYKRILYLKQYISFRKSQVEKIKEQTKSLELTKNDLAIQKDNLVLDSEKKLKLSENKKQELFSIAESKEEKRELIVELSKSEKKFTKQIKDKKKQKKQLDDKLRKIIDEEIRRARREAKNTGFEITPEVIALSAEFNENKGKLPWPLEKGVIVQRYGKQNHAVFGAIETFNNGIDIATEKNAAVRAVFDGTISRIFFIKGEGKAVLMNHGEYFSVYSGLQEVGVKVGEKLLAKEKIGVVFTQELDSKTELHFEIWKGYEKHDPSKWLYNTY